MSILWLSNYNYENNNQYYINRNQLLHQFINYNKLYNCWNVLSNNKHEQPNTYELGDVTSTLDYYFTSKKLIQQNYIYQMKISKNNILDSDHKILNLLFKLNVKLWRIFY